MKFGTQQEEKCFIMVRRFFRLKGKYLYMVPAAVASQDRDHSFGALSPPRAENAQTHTGKYLDSETW